MRKESNSHRIDLVHQHGRCFNVLYINMAAVTSCENTFCHTLQLKYVFWLEGNASRVVGQNSLTLKRNNNINFRLARPSTSMFLSASPRETLRVWGNKTVCSCTLRQRNLKTEICIIRFPSTCCAEGIWKRNNHQLFWICDWGQLGQGNHVIIVTSSFSKTSVSVKTSEKFPQF